MSGDSSDAGEFQQFGVSSQYHPTNPVIISRYPRIHLRSSKQADEIDDHQMHISEKGSNSIERSKSNFLNSCYSIEFGNGLGVDECSGYLIESLDKYGVNKAMNIVDASVKNLDNSCGVVRSRIANLFGKPRAAKDYFWKFRNYLVILNGFELTIVNRRCFSDRSYKIYNHVIDEDLLVEICPCENILLHMKFKCGMDGTTKFGDIDFAELCAFLDKYWPIENVERIDKKGRMVELIIWFDPGIVFNGFNSSENVDSLERVTEGGLYSMIGVCLYGGPLGKDTQHLVSSSKGGTIICKCFVVTGNYEVQKMTCGSKVFDTQGFEELF